MEELRLQSFVLWVAGGKREREEGGKREESEKAASRAAAATASWRTEALGVAGRSRSLFRGGERAGAPPSAREEGRGGHRGVSGAAAPDWGPPGGAGRGARAGRACPVTRASYRPRLGVGPRR